MKALKANNFHIGAKSVNYVKVEKFDDPAPNGMFWMRLNLIEN